MSWSMKDGAVTVNQQDKYNSNLAALLAAPLAGNEDAAEEREQARWFAAHAAADGVYRGVLGHGGQYVINLSGHANRRNGPVQPTPDGVVISLYRKEGPTAAQADPG